MKWLPGGWQRADRVDANRKTVPGNEPTRKGTTQFQATNVVSPPVDGPQGHGSATGSGGLALLGPEAQDVDVSASSFRNLLVGGGASGLLTVVCAAVLVNNGPSFWMWIWQLVFGVLFFWFITASRGMLASRGFLVDRAGFYGRTRGDLVGVGWQEISAVGIASLPWIHHRRPVNPERRQALEFFPADGAFPDRHPEFARWLVEEPPPMPGLPSIRYRFFLPPFSNVPRTMEQAVQAVAPRKWVGHYRRQLPGPPA